MFEKKHGLIHHRLYRIWGCMKTRCLNKNDEHFPLYGGRGITICDEWKHDFQAFYDWAMANGYQDNLTIDRIDVNGNYEPSNCRWLTRQEQNFNKRNTIFVTLNGETKSLAEWAAETGIYYQTLVYRYKAGKSPAEILKK